MPKGYQHLTQLQRCQIEALRSSGLTQKYIAKYIGVSASTISREVRRNNNGNKYDYFDAHLKYKRRRSIASSKPRILTLTLIKLIEKHIVNGWSPEQISGRLRHSSVYISHETIYKHIWRSRSLGKTLYLFLRRGGKKYRKRYSHKNSRSRIPGRVDIEDRPVVVSDKSRYGDWEGDTIVGAKHNGAILSYVERKSKYTILSKLSRKTARNVASATINRLKVFSKLALTITYDNGLEFSFHKKISEYLGADCYFAKPYHAWERGLNEHTNGLVREYFPKDTDLLSVSEREIRHVENLLNNRPRKVLGYQTPKEVFMQAMLSNDQIALQT